MQVYLRQAHRGGQFLEPPGDGIRVRGPAVLPAEQDPMIPVLRPELVPLLVERIDVRLEGGW
jgi:hypothetical protein